MTTHAVVVEPLLGPPGARIGPLLAESERQGLGFIRRLAGEWASGVNRFDRPGETLLVASLDGRAIGVCGLNVDPYAAHGRVGRVRHLYVLTAYRGRGTGARLVTGVVRAARGRFDILRLRTRNPEAARLYERLGFTPVDAEDCTHVLRLEGAAREAR